jgi:hypothetical protein
LAFCFYTALHFYPNDSLHPVGFRTHLLRYETCFPRLLGEFSHTYKFRLLTYVNGIMKKASRSSYLYFSLTSKESYYK